MLKNTIPYPYQYNYKLIGIATHLKDYRAAFFLNEVLPITLSKREDLTFSIKNKAKHYSFEKQAFFDEENSIKYILLQNKNGGNLFLKSLKNFDFIFIVKTENEIDFINDIAQKIKSIDNFSVVHIINKLTKTEQNLIKTQLIDVEDEEEK